MDLVKPRYIGENLLMQHNLFGDNPEAICESSESVETIRGVPTKRCTRCKVLKPRTKFPPQRNNGDGLHVHCHACHAENSRKQGRIKFAFVLSRKRVPCMDCGIIYPPQLMEFDHRPGTKKKFTIGLASTRSIAAITREMDKCDVVCVACHRVRTWNRLHPKDPISNPLVGKDIVRASQQCEEAGRNDQPWMN